jgi:hypothetical protein
MSKPEQTDSKPRIETGAQPAPDSAQKLRAPSLRRLSAERVGSQGPQPSTFQDGQTAPDTEDHPENPLPQGPSLTLLFSLVGLALAAAIGFALLIVLPFYHRR